MEAKGNKKKLVRILFYITLSIVVFAVSLLILPLELFLFSTVIIFATIRGIEKELSDTEKKDLSPFSGN